MPKKNPLVFLEISIAGGHAERLIIELFSDVVPMTAEKFRSLCTGEKSSVRRTSKPVHYKGSIIHRIVKGFVAQGGDFTRQDGSGGESIYGGKFPDENFKLNHDGRGILSMANSGQHTNDSQFFITFKAAPHLDGKHVVFGKIVQGMDFLTKIEQAGSDSGKPTCLVKIVNCGELFDNKATNLSMAKGNKFTKTGKDLSGGCNESVENHKSPANNKRSKRKRRYSSSDSYSSDDSDSDSYSTSSDSNLDSDSDPSSSSTSSSSDYKRKRRKKASKNPNHGNRKREKDRESRRRSYSKKSRRKSKWSSTSSSDSGSESSDSSCSDSKNPGGENIHKSYKKSPPADISAKISAYVEEQAITKKKAFEDYISQEEGELQENGESLQNIDGSTAQAGAHIDQQHIFKEISFAPRALHKKYSGGPCLAREPTRPVKVLVREPDRQAQLLAKASEPALINAQNITKEVSRDGAPLRIRKGRGFTKEYAFARRYRTPSPIRSPDRAYYYRGRNNGGRDAERYGRFRNYRERSPPRHSQRSPRSPHRRMRSISRSPPARYQGRGRDQISSPRRRRSPFTSDGPRFCLGPRGTSPSRRRARSRSRTRSRSTDKERVKEKNEATKKAASPTNSRSSSPAENKGLVSYGDGEP